MPAARRELALVKIGLIVVSLGLLVLLTVALFPGLAPPLTHAIKQLLAVLIPAR